MSSRSPRRAVPPTRTAAHVGAALALALAPGALVLTVTNPLHAQPAAQAVGRVTGTIIGDGAAPLANVQVSLEGTRFGALTDAEGRFTLANVPAGSYTLRAQRIGYTPATTPVSVGANATATVTLTLRVTATQLTTVVSVGYTNQARRDVSDATAGVTGAEIRDQKVATVEEAVRGRIPGVQVIASGEPGVAPQIQVRGQNNFSNVSPLFVVDGLYTSQNPNLNPNEIESIEVLKDASAAAQYGALAANGVVIIRTRRGRPGNNVVNLQSYYGYQQVPTTIDMMNSRQWAQIQQQTYVNAGRPVPAGVTAALNGQAISTDWQDALFRNGAIQDHNLSVSGGTQNASYLISGGFFDQRGAIINTGFNRYSFRANTDASRGRFRFGQSLAISQTNKQNPVGAPLIDAVRMLPTIPVYDANNASGYGYGNAANPTFGTNPVGVLERNPSTYRSNQLLGSAFGQVDLLPGLSYRLNLGANYNASTQADFTSIAQLRNGSANAFAQFSTNRGQYQFVQVENLLQFDRAFGGEGKHRVTAAGGITQQRANTSDLYGLRQGYADEALRTIAAGNTTGQRNDSRDVNYRLNSGLLRANYVFADRYIVTGSVRRDGSSRFGASNRYGTFGAASVAWVASEEQWFKSIPGLGSASLFKLRASTGVLGLDQIGDYATTVTVNQGNGYLFGQTPVTGVTQLGLANANLQWQENRTTNVGFDLGILDDRLSITADYYQANASKLLVDIPLPSSFGAAGTVPANAGEVRNSGFELGVTHRFERGAFRLSTTATLTTNRNRVESLGGGLPIFSGPGDVAVTQVGSPIASYYVARTAGIFRSQAEIDAYVNSRGQRIQPDARPGDLKFVDVNGDGTFNPTSDRYIAGNGTPRTTGGLFFDGRYKALDFGLNLRGAAGFKIFNGVKYWTDRGDEAGNFRQGYNPWSTTNPNGTDPRIVAGGTQSNLFVSDRWIEKGDFLRIQNVVLGYTIPARFASRLGTGATPRVYLNVQNLFTFTGYSNWDPEAVGNGPILTRGFDDARSFPQVRTVSFGVDLRL